MIRTALLTLALLLTNIAGVCSDTQALTNGVWINRNLRLGISDDALNCTNTHQMFNDTEVCATNQLFYVVYNEGEAATGVGSPPLDSMFLFRLSNENGKPALKTKFGITKHIPSNRPIPSIYRPHGIMVLPHSAYLNEWYSVSDLFQIETNKSYILEVQLCYYINTNSALFRKLSPPVRLRVKPCETHNHKQ